MKRLVVFLMCSLVGTGATLARAQVVPTATRHQMTIRVGALGSMFQPDYAGNGVPQEAPNRLYGWGGFVDIDLNRWVQFEAEGRWLRANPYINIREDNYLFGPRVVGPSYRKFKPYAKALVGYGRMNFQYNYAYGRFCDVALGGGVDYPLTHKLSVRVIDFEYQMWPNWVNGTLKPYGGSVGISYKVY